MMAYGSTVIKSMYIASSFTREGLVHFALLTCSSHPTGTVGQQLNMIIVMYTCVQYSAI